MAGIGGVPAPIYLPVDDRWGQLGRAIGSIGGNVFTGYNQAKALQDTRDMPPEQQAQELMRRLGPDGAKFVEHLMNIKKDSAEVERAKADTARAAAEVENTKVLTQLNEKRRDNFDKMQRLDEQVKLSEIRARNATAAGAGAMAAEHMERTRTLKMEREQTQKENMMYDALLPGMLQQLQGGGGGGEQTPRIQRQSQEGDAPQPQPIPTDTSGASARTIATQGDEGAGADSSKGISEQDTLQHKLALIREFEAGGDPTSGQKLKPIQLNADQQGEVLGHILRKDLAGAFATKNKYEQPTATEKREVGNTGFEATFARFADGSQQMVPGSLQDKRKPADNQLRQVSGGATLWSQTNDILKSLSNAKEGDPDADIQGNAGVRRLNAILQRNGLQPVGDENTRTFREAYNAIYQHNIVGITAILQGARQTQQLRNQLQETSANPTDTKEIRNQKFKATELTAEVIIKNEVETAVNNKQQVPPALMQVYLSKGLDRRDMGDLKAEYLSSFKGLGIKPLDPAAEGDIGGNVDRGTQGNSGSVKIGKITMDRAEAERMAKERGLTLDDVMKYAPTGP